MPPRVARTALLGALLAALIIAPAAQGRDGTITSFDGTTIAYSFFPAQGLAAGQRAPTLVNGPGYSMGRGGATDGTVTAAQADGYNVLTYDPRGFGQSGGRVEVDSPNYEARDVSALITTIAQQPEAQLDAPGDPRVGMIGASYGGGIQLNTAATDPRVDAITPQIAWHSLITSLDKDNTAKGGWGSVLFGAGTQGSTTGASNAPSDFGVGGRQDPATTQAFQDGLATGGFTPADQAFFASRGPGELIKQIHVPTLLMEGTDDTLFTLHEAIQNYSQLRANGVPVQMLWFCGGLTGGPVAHGVCNTSQGPDPKLDTDYALRWLDRWLKRNPSVDTGPRFSWISDDGALHGAGDYPVAHGPAVNASGSGTLVMAPGDTSGALIEAQPAANAVSVALPTPASGTELLGEPTLTLSYSGTSSNADGRVYAQIVDNQSHLVLGNQVTPIPVTLDGQPHAVTRSLEGIAIDVVRGKSYTLQVTDGANDYFAARSAGTVTLSASVSVPTVGAGASTLVAAPTRRSLGARGRCAATRRLIYHLHPPHGGVVSAVRIYVDGRLALVRRGRRVTRVAFVVSAAGGHRVRVDSFAAGGRLLRRSRHAVGRCGHPRVAVGHRRAARRRARTPKRH